MRFSEAEMAEFRRRAETLGQHFTPEERERMRLRAEQIGEAGMQQAQQAWPHLMRAAMDAGTQPDDPAVLDMGRRWHAMVSAFTGGDPGIARKLKNAYAKEPQMLAAQGMDAAMFAYIRAAMQAAGLTLSA